MVNRSDTLVNGSVDVLLDQPSEFSDNRSDILMNGSLDELLDHLSEFSDNRSDILVNGSLDELLDQPTEFSDIISQIEMYTDLVIFPFGVILNILCLITFVTSKISQSPTGLVLTYLAIFDNMVLISFFLLVASTFSKYINITIPTSSLMCQGTQFLLNAGFLLSGLLLAFSTIERYVSVKFALQVKSWNVYLKTKIFLVVFIISGCILSSFTFLCYDIIPLDIDRCLPSPKYEQFCYVSEIFVNTVLSNGLCTLLIFIFTILTSIELFKMKRRRTQMGVTQSTKEIDISIMLVTVATLFLILRIPEMILYQLINYLGDNNVFMAWQMSTIFVELNHSLNFIIYMIFVKKFRDTFFSFLIYIKLKCVRSEEPD